jgi:hypothetical protein
MTKGRKGRQGLATLWFFNHMCTSAQVLLSSIFTISLLAPAFYIACSDDSYTFPTEERLERRSSVDILVKKPSEALIGSADILIFNDDSLRRLDSYQKVDGPLDSKVQVTTRSGRKIMVILANSSEDRYRWGGIFSLEGLRKVTSAIEKEDPAAPVMSATASLDAGNVEEVAIEMTPLLCEVDLHSICCDFHGRPYDGTPLRNVNVYLVNVTRNCPVMADDVARPDALLNEGRLQEKDMQAMAHPEMVWQHLDEDICDTVLFPGLKFWCYPNESDTDMVGSPFTRLVIEGDIMGHRYYYPIDINREGFGYKSGSMTPDAASTRPGMHRNCRYILDITLTRTGTSDPDIPAASGTILIQSMVEPWTEKPPRTVDFD